MDEKSHEPLLSILTSIVETAVKLRKDGHRVIIVSSGAIGVGLRRMDVEKRPKHLPKLQVRQTLYYISDRRLYNVGPGCHRAMPVDESLGQPVQPPPAAHCPDTSHKE